MKYKHTDDIPMTQLNPATIMRNQEAFRRLLDRLPLSRVQDVYETCCGIGLQTECLLEKFPLEVVHSNDKAEECTSLVREKFPGLDVSTSDLMDFLGDRDMSRSLLVYDVNNVTFKNKSSVEDGIRRGPEILMVPDLAKGKLHLNFRSYGLDKGATVEDYMAQWGRWAGERGWTHHWEPSVRSICYMAFTRRG